MHRCRSYSPTYCITYLECGVPLSYGLRPWKLRTYVFSLWFQRRGKQMLIAAARGRFMHDGASAHLSRNVRNHCDITYLERWTGRGGPAAWRLFCWMFSGSPWSSKISRLWDACGHPREIAYRRLLSLVRHRCHTRYHWTRLEIFYMLL